MEWEIGKAYKTRDGRKFILVGNYRLANNGVVNYPLLFSDESVSFSTTILGQLTLREAQSDKDIVGEWDVPSNTVKRARAIIRRKGVPPSITSYYYRDTEEILNDYFHDVDILEFPLEGVWKEFRE